MTATKLCKPRDKNISVITASQRNLLIRTALHVITEKIPPFDMRFYARDKDEDTLSPYEIVRGVNECGASCCMMGIAAFISAMENPYDESDGDNYPVWRTSDWSGFGKQALGVFNNYEKNGQFMFSGNWTNDRQQAAARVLVWLRGQDVESVNLTRGPKNDQHEWFYTNRFLPSYSLTKLRSELKKFIVEE